MYWAEAQPLAFDESIQCSNPMVSYIQLNISKSRIINMYHTQSYSRLQCQYDTCSHSYALILGCTVLNRSTTGRLRLAFTHLHRFVQAFLQPHFNSSWQLLASSGRVVQHGIQEESSVILFLPHESGDGTSGSLMSDCPQMWLAW